MYPAKVLAEALGISLSRVYYILRNEINMSERKDKLERRELVTPKIKELTRMYPYYGYRKIYAILKYKEGITVRRNTVYRIMKENKLLLPPTHSNKKLFKGVSISMNVEATRSNALWGIDMTYIWCGEDAWCYLHAFPKQLYVRSRRVEPL